MFSVLKGSSELSKHSICVLVVVTIVCLNDERETALIGVSSDLQESYDVVRRHKGGIAVAEVTDNICTVCGMAPSAVRIRQARSGVDPPVKCGNCARIMYVK